MPSPVDIPRYRFLAGDVAEALGSTTAKKEISRASFAIFSARARDATRRSCIILREYLLSRLSCLLYFTDVTKLRGKLRAGGSAFLSATNQNANSFERYLTLAAFFDGT